jgi:hypothetical protein
MGNVAKFSKTIREYGDSINIDLAVGLLVFAIDGHVDRATKEFVRDAFTGAGCRNADELTTACVEMYNRLSPELVRDWVDNRGTMRMVESISKNLEPYGFKSVDDVMAFCRIVPSNSMQYRPVRQRWLIA